MGGGNSKSSGNDVARAALDRALEKNKVEPIDHLSTEMPANNEIMEQANDAAYVLDLFAKYPGMARLATVSGAAFDEVDARGGDTKCLSAALDLSQRADGVVPLR